MKINFFSRVCRWKFKKGYKFKFMAALFLIVCFAINLLSFSRESCCIIKQHNKDLKTKKKDKKENVITSHIIVHTLIT